MKLGWPLAAPLGCTLLACLFVSPPPAGADGPAAFPIAPCPVPAADLAQYSNTTPTPLSREAMFGESEAELAGAVPGGQMYGTSFPVSTYPRAGHGFTFAPSGFSCSAGAGVDGALWQKIHGPTNHDIVETIFVPGGEGFSDELGCEYIPAARASVQQSDPQSAAVLGCRPPAKDTITQLPTNSQTAFAALVRVPPGGSSPGGEPTGSDPTWALVMAYLGEGKTVSAQAIWCTLPSAQQSLCLASLAVFAGQAHLGEFGGDQQTLIQALKAAMQAPAAFTPAEPCDAEAIELKLSGMATAGIFAFGDEGTIDWARRSDTSWGIDAQGKFKVGLGGVFGAGAHAGAAADADLGADGSVAGGLELGLGVGLQVGTGQDSRSLIEALGSPETSPPASVSLTSTTVAVGAWLSGDIGVSSASGNLDAEAVVGDRTDFQGASEVDNEYYLEVSVAGEASGAPRAGSVATPLGAGGFGSGSLLVGETVDTVGEPTTGELGVNLGAGGAGQIDAASALPKQFSGLANISAGEEIQAKMTLDLANRQNRDAWNALMSDQGSNTLNGLAGDSAPSASDVALAKAMAITVVRYNTEKLSGSISGKFGDGVGLGLSFDGEATYRKAVGAAFKAPGSVAEAPWDACLQGGGSGI
jgi:hypothetical protein